MNKDWKITRKAMEVSRIKYLPRNKVGRKHWDFFHSVVRIAMFFFKITGLFYLGKRYAKKIKITPIIHSNDKELQTIPLRILHLSDLHFDERPELFEQLIELTKTIDFDLICWTGDYFTYSLLDSSTLNHELKIKFSKLIQNLNPLHGHFAVLGNHDSTDIADFLKSLGITVLINDYVSILHEGKKITLVGTDDVHYFYTPNALEALYQAPKNDYKIALIHSAEMYDLAEETDVDLYLCGHTHGGQICHPYLPPLFTHLKRGRRFARGLWKFKRMHGYTSNGVGTSLFPVRLFCPAEIVLHKIYLEV